MLVKLSKILINVTPELFYIFLTKYCPSFGTLYKSFLNWNDIIAIVKLLADTEDVKNQLEEERQKLINEINTKIAKKKKLMNDNPVNEYLK